MLLNIYSLNEKVNKGRMRYKLVDENKLMIFITFGLGKCRPSSFIESFIEIKVG